MNIEVGKTYQSRSFPHITRKVLRVRDGIVYYAILDDRKGEDAFRRIAKAVESEFRNCSTHEITTQMKPKCPTCNGSTLVIVEKFNVLSKIGFSQVAVPCPECRPHLQPKIYRDGKMAAAGDTQ